MTFTGLPRRGAPDYFNDWVDWCSERIRVALSTTGVMPSQLSLEGEWGPFTRATLTDHGVRR